MTLPCMLGQSNHTENFMSHILGEEIFDFSHAVGLGFHHFETNGFLKYSFPSHRRMLTCARDAKKWMHNGIKFFNISQTKTFFF